MPFEKDGGVIPAGTKFSFSAEGITTFPLGIGTSYEVKGNILSITISMFGDIQIINLTIVELTNSTLKFGSEDGNDEDVFVMKRVK